MIRDKREEIKWQKVGDINPHLLQAISRTYNNNNSGLNSGLLKTNTTDAHAEIPANLQKLSYHLLNKATSKSSTANGALYNFWGVFDYMHYGLCFLKGQMWHTYIET